MIDAHTHRLKRNAIVNIDPVDIRQPQKPPTHPQSIPYTPSAPAYPTGAQHPGSASALHPLSAPALLAGPRPAWLPAPSPARLPASIPSQFPASIPSQLPVSTPILFPSCAPALLPGYNYSIGIHPWNVFTATPADLRLLRALVADPRVLAIGECGLDPNLPATHPASSPASTAPQSGSKFFSNLSKSSLKSTEPLPSLDFLTISSQLAEPLSHLNPVVPSESTAPFPSPNLSAIFPQSAARERAEASGTASPSARFVSVEGFSPQSNSPQSKNPISPIPPKALNFPSFSRAEILAAQTALLRIHYELSETLRKPLILHIVKSFPEIIALRKQWKPTQPWIIHGFRGKPQLARELLAHGFHLSYGKKYNPASLAITPASRLLRETDEKPF